MKAKTLVTYALLAFVAVSVIVFIVQEAQQQPAAAGTTGETGVAAEAEPAPEHQVLVYYFHGNTRCPSCVKIESWSKTAVVESFVDELEEGLVVWETVNTDEKGNEHYNEDYELYTKSVVIVDMVKGEQARYYNLAKVWDLLSDQEEFSAYVVDGVQAYLDGEELEEEGEEQPQ